MGWILPQSSQSFSQSQQNYYEIDCPSPDRSEHPFVPAFGAKDKA
jgi:hypothetical protein